MNKTFREQYKYEQDLESGLANAWGYSLANTSIDLKEKKHIQTTRPIVANITLRKFGKDIQKTERIKQVQDEIRGLENQRMLRQLKESKYKESSLDQKSQVINLMESMIEDYNNIIQHKHLMSKSKAKHEDKIHVNERKNQNQKLLEVIQRKKSQLLNADLNEQIKLNKEIAKLYRQYNEMENNLSSISLKNNRSIAPEIPFTYKTMKKHQSQTFEKLEELASIHNMNKFLSLKMSNSDQQLREMAKFLKKKSDFSRQTDEKMMKKFKQLQFKKFSVSNRKQSICHPNSIGNSMYSAQKKPKKMKKNIQQQIKSPFLDKKSVEEYRQMEKKIRSNSQALQLWKGKINDASHNSRLKKQAEKLKQMNKRKAQIEMQHREQQIEHALQKSIQIMSIGSTNVNNVFTREFRENQQKHELEKQKIFAELLRKKNNKFNKLWGTKILVKYDSQKQAKSMLKGTEEKNPNRKVHSSMSHRRNKSFNSKVGGKDIQKMNKTQQIQVLSARTKRQSQQQSQISWKDEQKDQQHYWRMCKNQKVNLLLKRR